MEREMVPVVIAVAIAAGVFSLVFVFSRRQSAKIREILLPILTAAGWSDLTAASFAGSGLRGTWRTLPVELAYFARYKSTPARFILRIRFPNVSRLIIKRRMHGWLSRPFTMFGPPIVEVRHKAAEELWVRADEVTLADRIFADDRLGTMIAANLVASFDQVRTDRNGVHVIRALDDRAVRAKYNFPTFTMSFEPARYEPIAREIVALGEAMATKLT